MKRKSVYVTMYATNQSCVSTCSSSIHTYAMYVNCQTLWLLDYCRKNPNKGVEDILFKRNPLEFLSVTLPCLEIPDKKKLHRVQIKKTKVYCNFIRWAKQVKACCRHKIFGFRNEFLQYVFNSFTIIIFYSNLLEILINSTSTNN